MKFLETEIYRLIGESFIVLVDEMFGAVGTLAM